MVTESGALPELLDLMNKGDLKASRLTSLFARPEFLPALLRAHANGGRAVRPILWDIAVRYELRLMSDGRVVLSSGEDVSWDDVPALLS